MPANPKYLTKSISQRFAKVSAAVLGSFLVSASTMLAAAVWSERPKAVFLTFAYAMFIEWCTLMLLAFLFNNGWKCWALYGAVTVLMLILCLAGPEFKA